MIDFGALFSQLFAPFWWLLPLFVLITLLKSVWFKGVMGEFMVYTADRLFLDKNDYHLTITERNIELGKLPRNSPPKKGPNAGNHFWGCSAFPKCRTVVAME